MQQLFGARRLSRNQGKKCANTRLRSNMKISTNLHDVLCEYVSKYRKPLTATVLFRGKIYIFSAI